MNNNKPVRHGALTAALAVPAIISVYLSLIILFERVMGIGKIPSQWIVAGALLIFLSAIAVFITACIFFIIVSSVPNSVRRAATLEKPDESMAQLDPGFISAISGIRRHIGAVNGWFRLFSDDLSRALDDKEKKALDVVRNNLLITSESMDKMLEIAKIDFGKMDIRKEAVDMRSIVSDAIFINEPKIRQKGLDFRLDAPKDEVMVLADTDKMTKALNYIIENSLKFTKKGHIGLSIKEINDEVECIVTDTGIGMKMHDLPGIFKRFQDFKIIDNT